MRSFDACAEMSRTRKAAVSVIGLGYVALTVASVAYHGSFVLNVTEHGPDLDSVTLDASALADVDCVALPPRTVASILTRYPGPLPSAASYGLAASSRVVRMRPLSEDAWLAVLDSAQQPTARSAVRRSRGWFTANNFRQMNQARDLQVSVMAWAMCLERELLAAIDLLTTGRHSSAIA